VTVVLETQWMIGSPDLHITALEESVQHLGPSFTYELTVSNNMFAFARTLMRQIAADALGNPFAPHINVRVDTEFKYGQWKIEANGKSIGSQGY
jgi:hypothetical protein